MGWSFNRDPTFGKAELVAKFRSLRMFVDGTTVLADRVVGNHYWAALKVPDGRVTIFLALMKCGGRSMGYGYESMEESARPAYYDCPLALLAMATEPPNAAAAKWREMVREYHRRRLATPKPTAGLQVRAEGVDYELLSPSGPGRGWNVKRCGDGAMFRMDNRTLYRALAAIGRRRAPPAPPVAEQLALT